MTPPGGLLTPLAWRRLADRCAEVRAMLVRLLAPRRDPRPSAVTVRSLLVGRLPVLSFVLRHPPPSSLALASEPARSSRRRVPSVPAGLSPESPTTVLSAFDPPPGAVTTSAACTPSRSRNARRPCRSRPESIPSTAVQERVPKNAARRSAFAFFSAAVWPG